MACSSPTWSSYRNKSGEVVSESAKCELCGEPMPPGEEMFKYHGYSGPCPKSPLESVATFEDWLKKMNSHPTQKLTCEVRSTRTGDVVTVWVLAGYENQAFLVSGNQVTLIKEE
jgi:hypothetical protein